MPASVEKLTPLEATVMDCAWELHEATVRETKELLDRQSPRAYNTVLTIMRILRDKGYLESRRVGRSDVYRPVVSRRQAARRPLRELLQHFFAGSAQALVSQLLEVEGLSQDEVEAIRREIDEKLNTES